MRHKTPQPAVPTVKVIRDVRDYRKDYDLPRERAEALLKEGKLVQIQATARGFDYAHRSPNEPKFS